MGSEKPLNEPLPSGDAVEREDGGGVIEGGCIAVPDGNYELRYMYYETGNYFGSPKVVVHFAIDASDIYAGIPVCRYYNVKMLSGPCRKFGNYIASPCGNLSREYKQLVREPERMDRISFRALRGKRILGELETVTTNHEKRALSPNGQYSRVARLVKVLPDEDW